MTYQFLNLKVFTSRLKRNFSQISRTDLSQRKYILGIHAISGKLESVEYVDLVVTEFKISNRTLAKNNLLDHLKSTIVCKLGNVFVHHSNVLKARNPILRKILFKQTATQVVTTYTKFNAQR